MRSETPLFPLPTVLFPEGPLPLRVFEPRYLDMVGRCMREDEPFGVIRIKDDSQSSATQLCKIGTLAIIADWFQSEGGMLGILAIGSLRFQLHATAVQDDGLRTGDIEELPPEPQVPMPPEFISMGTALQHLIQKLDRLYQGIEKRFDDASWVSLRLAEILPIGLEHKQHCLELEDPVERLRYLRPLLRLSR
ncbi:LON peptidase substrate-binding domain-containing protein [Candidatus Foliamicus sp.]